MNKENTSLITMMLSVVLCAVVAGCMYVSPSPIGVGCTVGSFLCCIINIANFFVTTKN